MTEPTGRDPDILTTEEVAARLGVSPQTVRRMAEARQIPALKAGKNYRYSWTAILDRLRAIQPGDDPGDPTSPSTSRGAGHRAHQRIRQHTHTEAGADLHDLER